jgi:hypothetical protein
MHCGLVHREQPKCSASPGHGWPDGSIKSHALLKDATQSGDWQTRFGAVRFRLPGIGVRQNRHSPFARAGGGFGRAELSPIYATWNLDSCWSDPFHVLIPLLLLT